MPRALKVCPATGCPNLVTAGRCDTHTQQAEQRRGSRHQRGYGKAHTTRFRPGVLRRDPLCVCIAQHGEPGSPARHHGQCLRPSTVADHWPRDRRELVRLGLDPNDPQYGRGLCPTCHNWHTATAQPGGWNAG